MDRGAFETLISDAIGDLPEEFRRKLENVAIIVQDYPSEELLDQVGVPPGHRLFGLSKGVPLTMRRILRGESFRGRSFMHVAEDFR